MADEQTLALKRFAIKHDVRIKLLTITNQKHPDFESYLDVYKIRVSRKRKSFIINWGAGQLGFDEGEKFTDTQLSCAVLSGFVIFNPVTFPKSFSEYYKELWEGSSDPIERIKRCYKVDLTTYRNVMRLFPDIIDDLLEILYS